MTRTVIFLQICLVSTTLGSMMGKTASQGNMTLNLTEAEQKYFNLTVQIENYFKKGIKAVTKSMLPQVMSLQEDQLLSGQCMQSLMKYVINLSKAKIWAVEMLDATSKPPPGIFSGTLADFGDFDECLQVKVRKRDGTLDFQGSSCAIELKLPTPAPPKGYSLAKIRRVDNDDTLGAQFREVSRELHFKHSKLVACVPSTCSAEDIRHIVEKITNGTNIHVEVPKCYVKEETKFSPIHIAVIISIIILLILGIAGSLLEDWKLKSGEKISGKGEKSLAAFSLRSNFKSFISTEGSSDLKCLFGLRTLGIFYIILSHTYIYMDYDTLKDPTNIQNWLGSWSFEVIQNGWFGVEVFFLISGMLVVFGGMKQMVKSHGKSNVPLLIFRRYFRLTPSVVMLMGLVFFMPLVSSGPFWYHLVDPQVDSCRQYWWTTLLYFSNWWGIDKGCLHTTWYLAADFQLHILARILLIALYRYAKATLGFLVLAVLFSCTAIGAQTWFWDLRAQAHLSTGDKDLALEVVNKIHIQTSTHLGAYCIGMILGYYIFKYREKKMSKQIVILGWCASAAVCLTSLFGDYRFSSGKEDALALRVLYASLCRSAFTCGLAWVLLACITGNGGPVNSFLSSSIMAPLGRLTYMIYLVHPLVVWTQLGSMKERLLSSHYDFVYLFITNVVISIALAVPFYLLLEAPLANLERILISQGGKDKDKSKNDNLTKTSTEKNNVTLTKMNLGSPEFQPNLLNVAEKSNS